jgi:hypothetical protein
MALANPDRATRLVLVCTSCTDGCIQMAEARRERREELRRQEEAEGEEV